MDEIDRVSGVVLAAANWRAGADAALARLVALGHVEAAAVWVGTERVAFAGVGDPVRDAEPWSTALAEIASGLVSDPARAVGCAIGGASLAAPVIAMAAKGRRKLGPADRLLLASVARVLAKDARRRGEHPWAFATRAIHTGDTLSGPVHPAGLSIVPSVSFEFESLADLVSFQASPGSGYLYARWSNPTVRAVEDAVASLERAPRALLFASGMGAISASLLALLSAGDELLAVGQLYGEALRLMHGLLVPLGIRVRFVETGEVEGAIGPATRLVYGETISNPTLRVLDIPRVAAVCRARGVPFALDSTFASPVLCRPLEHGADLVIHSATKYLGGHGDLTAGAVCGSEALIQRIELRRRMLGNHADAQAAWLLGRGLKTLSLRMRHHVDSARRVVSMLAASPGVVRVLYPSQPDHPEHALAQQLLPDGAGGIVAFELDSLARAIAFGDALGLIRRAASLGSAESLCSLPCLTSHHGFPPAELARMGIAPGLVRLSLGLEDPADLEADIAQALARAAVSA